MKRNIKGDFHISRIKSIFCFQTYTYVRNKTSIQEYLSKVDQFNTKLHPFRT